MAGKFAVLLLAVFLFFVPVLSAQDVSPVIQSGYFIDYDSTPPRIIQRFVWNKEEYAMHYNVQIQIFEDYGFTLHENIVTVNPYVDVILSPGRYRYSVTPYDFLGRPGDSSVWTVFEILPAYFPMIDRFLPNVINMDKRPVDFYEDKRPVRILNLAGYNFLEESEIYLRHSDPEKNLYPIQVDIINDKRARLYFDDETLVRGLYDIYIVNPGDVEFIMPGYRIGYRKPIDFFVKTGYTPVIPIHGELNEIFGNQLYLAGITAGLELINSQRTFINAGFDFAFSVFYLGPVTSLKADIFEIREGFMNNTYGMLFREFDINLTLQKKFYQRLMGVNLRLGLGFATVNGFGDYYREDYYMKYNLGLTYMFQVYDVLVFEAGVDYNHHRSETPSGLIKPKLSIAWKI